MEQRDRPDGIELTSQMIEAGEFALSCADDWSLSSAQTVEAVYRAMWHSTSESTLGLCGQSRRVLHPEDGCQSKTGLATSLVNHGVKSRTHEDGL